MFQPNARYLHIAIPFTTQYIMCIVFLVFPTKKLKPQRFICQIYASIRSSYPIFQVRSSSPRFIIKYNIETLESIEWKHHLSTYNAQFVTLIVHTNFKLYSILH